MYIPDKDQSNIGIYDTTPLQDDYDGLFRDKRFSGLDRIAQANQYSWGVTSRLFNSDNIERFRFSIGRIVYLNNSNFSVYNNQEVTAKKSALATEVSFFLSRRWQFSSDIQYNTNTDMTSKSQTTIDYVSNNGQVIQFYHRYARDVSGSPLEQISLLANIAINPQWQFVGRITQDLHNKRSIESYLGFQYESCCWAVRFAYHRHINSNIDEHSFDFENRDEFDSGFMVEFVIKGLGSNKKSIDSSQMFNSSIFGYKRPYFLNN